MDERKEFEAWLGVKPCGAAHDLAWVAWKARAALAAQGSGQAKDPLQPAANWLVNDADVGVHTLAGKLMIGINRAQRLFDAARAAAKEQS